MSEHVPTTDQVKARYVMDRTYGSTITHAEAQGGFNLWLQSLKAEVWDEGWNAGYDDRVASTDDRSHRYAQNPFLTEGTGL